MTNIIYNEFIQKFFGTGEGGVDMLAPNCFKLALFSDNYTPNANSTATYDSLSSTGVIECVDENTLYEDNPNKGYKKGGKYIQFTQVSSDSGDFSYSCGSVQWNNVTLTENGNTAKYAIIYRESDGLMICCFPFSTSLILHDEELVLSWNDTVTLSVSATASLSIDTQFDKYSKNAVQNRVITEGLEKIYSGIEKYGIRLNGESEDSDEQTDEDNIDTLDRIEDNYIDSLFDEE